MKYSVIIPCYNTASTIEQTVMSVRKSGLTDYEIILMDDGSKDNTPCICDRLADTYDNIRVFHKANEGVSSARNYGLNAAQGEYIWFFDSDDQVNLGSMTRCAQIIEGNHPDILMFGMSFDYYAGKRQYQRLELYYDQECLLTQNKLKEVFSELYHNNMLTPCWNKLYRRELLLNNGILFHQDMFVMEDFLFSLEALKKCNTVYILPQVIYRYNQRSILANNSAAQRVNRIMDLEAYLNHFETELSDYPEILTGLFFMLLRQKLSVQSLDEIAKTARIVCSSKYVSDPYTDYHSDSDRVFLRKLQKGKYKEVYWQYKKSKVRNIVITLVKRTYLYSLIKGSSAKRVIW